MEAGSYHVPRPAVGGETAQVVPERLPRAETWTEHHRVVDELAALRRVATLVAQGVGPEPVFAAAANELRHVLPTADFTMVGRYDDDSVQVVGAWNRADDDPAGSRRARSGSRNVSLRMVERDTPPHTLTAAAREMGIRSSVGAPIDVDGRPWGVILVGSRHEDGIPPGTGHRLDAFAELVATAITNARTREELRTLADEHAALRRVTGLVTHAEPQAVLAAVAEEVARLVPADRVVIDRHRPDDTLMGVARWSRSGDTEPVGCRAGVEGRDVPALVTRTGLPARVDSYVSGLGSGVPEARVRCNGSVVGAPIDIGGRLWGVLTATSNGPEPLPSGTEIRLAGLAELVATAIATAEAMAELTASRARAVARVDEMRRRIERDLHDGAQQRLVSLALQVRAAQATVPPELDQVTNTLDEVVAGLTDALDELREFGRGIHPAVLAEGLTPALKALARRSSVPVDLDLRTQARLPERIEVAAYYVVSEALTNTAKHARASVARVVVDTADGVVHVSVRDDGIGGADVARGTGLVGLMDRAEALGGRITLDSPHGAGTLLRAELPLGGR